MDVVAPLIIIAILGATLLSLAARRFSEVEYPWLVRVLLIGFVLRLCVATMFALFPSTRIFHEDASGYEQIGLAIAAGWRGEGPPLDLYDNVTQNYGFPYFCAALYIVSNMCRVVPSYVNAFIGTLTVFFIYRLARQFFHVVVARRAALLCAFIPSMILWSAIALKDAPMTLLIVLALSSCVRLKRRLTIGAFFGTALPVLLIQPLRFYIVYVLGFAIAASLVIDRGLKTVANLPKQVALVGITVLLLVGVGASGRISAGTEVLSFERVSSFRRGMARTAESGFSHDVDISTPRQALMFLPVGMAYLLLSPFPWQLGSLRAALALPEMLLWWAMLPALWRGIRFAARTRFPECSPLLVFAIVLTLAYSLVHGNVGSGFRQRAQIFVFLFIFAALGQYFGLCRRRAIDPELLLKDLYR